MKKKKLVQTRDAESKPVSTKDELRKNVEDYLENHVLLARPSRMMIHE